MKFFDKAKAYGPSVIALVGSLCSALYAANGLKTAIAESHAVAPATADAVPAASADADAPSMGAAIAAEEETAEGFQG